MYGRAILFLGIAIVMGFGAYLLSMGEITPFFYIMCLLAALQIYEPIMQLFVLVISMARINQCVEKLSALKEEKALDVTEPAQTTEHSDISFKDVRFAYDGKEEVIKGITFEIPERRFAALVGTSGSGKTTIARLLPATTLSYRCPMAMTQRSARAAQRFRAVRSSAFQLHGRYFPMHR